MAAASGQPQDTKVKKEVTPDQKKTYAAVGAIGVLALIAGFMYIPGMLKGGSTSSTATSAGISNTSSNAASPSSSPMPDGSGAPGSVSPGEGGAADPTLVGASTASLNGAPLMKAKQDPFMQPYLYPTPAPTQPPPVDVPPPDESVPISLPGSDIDQAQLQKPLNLPPVQISRLDEAARRPTEAFPPRRSAATGSGGQTVTPSFDKRLSGVVIGDGVRALLEITGPNGIVTRVVQPGDEVDGITVLNIQRFNDGTRTVTRMIIRENGEERSVELRAGAQQQLGGEGGLEGSGPPGGFGGPGGFGSSQRR